MNALLNNEYYEDDDLDYNDLEYNDWDIDTLHNAIIADFKDYDLKTLTSNLRLHSEMIISLLSKMPSMYTFKFVKFIDKNIPGMTIYFVMDARHNYEDNDNIEQIENLLFLFRLSYYLVCFPEKKMVAGIRTTFCNNLILVFVKPSFFIEFNQKMQAVNNNLSINRLQKKQIKKNLYVSYFQLYMNKMIEELYLDEE